MKRLIYIYILIVLQCCKHIDESGAMQWTENIKSEVLQEYATFNDILIDSAKMEIRYYRENFLLRVTRFNTEKETLPFTDTFSDSYFSPDGKFEYLRFYGGNFKSDPDKPHQNGIEGMRYMNKFYGQMKLRDYYSRKITIGIVADTQYIGNWRVYDSNGVFLEQYNYGHLEKLKEISRIRYND